MKKQSLITILLTVLMSMAGAKSFAHDIAIENDGVTIYYEWANNNTELAVSYRGGSGSDYYNEYSDNVVIPSSVVYNGNTYPVTSISYQAFYGCRGLTSVTIPNSVTSIGSSAFYNCSGLSSVTIPNSVTSIGYDAFFGCSGLTSVNISDLATWCNIKFGEYNSNPLYYAHHLYINGNEITNLVIPNSVTSIGYQAFFGCSSLTSVTIPNSVTSIGRSAFSGCSGLTSVTIPNSVTSLGDWAFSGCSGLTSVNINCSPTTIGDRPFYNCSEIEEVSFDCEKVTSLFNSLSSVKKVTLSNNVKTIGDEAFSGCSGLTSVTIPNSVTSIGRSAFSECYGLNTVIIGSGVLSIGSNAFYNTYLKKTIWLTNTPPSGYSYASGTVNYVSNAQFDVINKYVYKFLSSNFVVDGIRYVPVSPSERTCDAIDCTYDAAIEKINIGETVTNKGVTLTVKNVNPYTCYGNKYIKDVKLSLGGDVGNNAFYGCTGLNTATVSNKGSIGFDAFCGCSLLETAELGQNVTSIGRYAFGSCSQLKSIVIPDAVTSIGYSAFSDCSSMTSAKIGNGVEKIDESAFSGCSALPSITIPQAVTTIGYNVFYNCTSLAKVTIADSESTLTLGSNGSKPIFASCPLDYVYIGRDISYKTSSSSGYSPFYRNTSLRAVKITDKETEISENEFYGCTNLQQVEIGDGVTTIGNWAFSGCSSLKYFAFGSQVTNIGQEAFSDCTAVTEITSLANTPPACGSQALDDINKWECKLYVPKGCQPTYGNAEQWKDFFYMEEGVGTLLQAIVGDANVDGKVNAADIVEMVNAKNGKPSAIFNLQNADMDGNNEINQADIDAVVSIIMSQE